MKTIEDEIKLIIEQAIKKFKRHPIQSRKKVPPVPEKWTHGKRAWIQGISAWMDILENGENSKHYHGFVKYILKKHPIYNEKTNKFNVRGLFDMFIAGKNLNKHKMNNLEPGDVCYCEWRNRLLIVSHFTMDAGYWCYYTDYPMLMLYPYLPNSLTLISKGEFK